MPEVENQLDVKRRELENLLSEMARQEMRARRRAVLYTVIPVLAGVAFLLFAFLKFSDLQKRSAEMEGQVASASAEIEKKKGEIEQLDAAKKTLEDSISQLNLVMKSIAEGEGDPKQQARKGLQIIAKTPIDNKPIVGPTPQPTVRPTPQPNVSPSPSWPGGGWAVVAGGSPTLEGASQRMQKARSLGYMNVGIYYRDNFRTVIQFSSKAEAESQLRNIKASLDPDAYIRDLNVWCLNPSQKGYIQCQKK